MGSETLHGGQDAPVVQPRNGAPTVDGSVPAISAPTLEACNLCVNVTPSAIPGLGSCPLMLYCVALVGDLKAAVF